MREKGKHDWAFSHDVTAAVLVLQNSKAVTMLVFQTNPMGVKLFSNVNAFFCSNEFTFIIDAGHTSKKALHI